MLLDGNSCEDGTVPWVSLMRGQRIVALQLDSRGMATNDATLELPSTRTRTLVQGPDGNLYTANDEGEIWRVVPK